MARVEWVKLRLDNWALYKARERGGAMGFAREASFSRDAVTDRYREAQIPVDDVDAGVTDQGVESLKGGQRHLYDTLHCIYVHGIGVAGTALALQRAESTVKANLEHADHALARWFSERSQRRRGLLR